MDDQFNRLRRSAIFGLGSVAVGVASRPVLAHSGDHGQLATAALLEHMLSRPHHVIGIAVVLCAMAAAAGALWHRRKAQ